MVSSSDKALRRSGIDNADERRTLAEPGRADRSGVAAAAGPRREALRAGAVLLATAGLGLGMVGRHPAAHAVAEPPQVPFVPTPPEAVEGMLDLAQVGPRDVVYDLGSGDGRIVIAAARRGARAVGIDIDAKLVEDGRANAAAAGLAARTRFMRGDFFTADLSEATVITLYLLPRINLELRPRLLALAPGTRIVSHAFDMGDWKPDRTVIVRSTPLHLWRVPAR
jgi:SAM-dependent methyltransferase